MIKNKTILLATLVAGAFTAAAFNVTAAEMATSADMATMKMERCAAVVKSGMGDGKTEGGAEWINLPEGVCSKLVGGMIIANDAANVK